MLKVVLAQINPTVGALAENCAKIISYIKRARAKGADIVVFPELSLIGYPPEDLLRKNHFISKSKQFLSSIVRNSRGLIAVIGFVDQEGLNLYNASALIQDGKICDVYRKVILPNYGVFDEKRHFSPGTALSVYNFGNYKFSVTICEDIWQKETVSLLENCDLDFVINISASPFNLGKMSQREKVLAQAARRLKSFIFYANLIGGQDEIVFDGTSKVISPQGKLIACAKRFQEDLLVFNLNRKKNYPTKKIKEEAAVEAFSALKLGLYDYVNKNGFKKVVVGVSGGIDSAVVVSLAVIALGKDNVSALLMPSVFTSDATYRDAKKICESLGIKYYIVKINDILNAYFKDLSAHFKGKKPDITEENLQARIRGNILMAFSNKFDYLVLNTGNKSEVSCGYCTLYGDMVGGFGVLKDVPKLLVYKLAQQINKISSKKVIPDSVIKRPPSAELKSNQKDTDSLPDYKLLDAILKFYVEDDLSLEEIVAKGYNKAVVRRVITMVDSNEYKRRQAPVGIKITPRALGKDRRMPITNKFSQ
ncbi:MAG: NAD+ synthase [Candidatus Omnitrophica bacterium]|nr:NAD+ synthase [Candidatus Omnitrophota bacterium]